MLLMTPVVLFSLTVHEYSHGKMAFLLGDDTAKRLGRLSFNPIRHLDIIGVLFSILWDLVGRNRFLSTLGTLAVRVVT